MKFVYQWNLEKNARLMKERGLSFEMVVEAANIGAVIEEFDHPNEERSHQRIMVIEINGYMVCVPHVVAGEVKFLKTMYFDRNIQKKYGAKNGRR